MAESDRQGIGQEGLGAGETTNDLTETTEVPEITYQDLIASIYNVPPSSSPPSSSAISPHSGVHYLQESVGPVINKEREILTQTCDEGSDGTGIGGIGHGGRGRGRGGFFGLGRGLKKVATQEPLEGEPAVFKDRFISRGRGRGLLLGRQKEEELPAPVSPLLAQVAQIASDTQLDKEIESEFATCIYTPDFHLVPKDQLDNRYQICTAHMKFIHAMEESEEVWRKSVQRKGYGGRGMCNIC